MRVVVRPMHQPAQLVPLVQTAKFNPVTDTDRHTFGQIDIVRDQQRVPIPDL